MICGTDETCVHGVSVNVKVTSVRGTVVITLIGPVVGDVIDATGYICYTGLNSRGHYTYYDNRNSLMVDAEKAYHFEKTFYRLQQPSLVTLLLKHLR